MEASASPPGRGLRSRRRGFSSRPTATRTSSGRSSLSRPPGRLLRVSLERARRAHTRLLAAPPRARPGASRVSRLQRTRCGSRYGDGEGDREALAPTRPQPAAVPDHPDTAHPVSRAEAALRGSGHRLLSFAVFCLIKLETNDFLVS